MLELFKSVKTKILLSHSFFIDTKLSLTFYEIDHDNNNNNNNNNNNKEIIILTQYAMVR
jgi:hypothetical protein